MSFSAPSVCASLNLELHAVVKVPNARTTRTAQSRNDFIQDLSSSVPLHRSPGKNTDVTKCDVVESVRIFLPQKFKEFSGDPDEESLSAFGRVNGGYSRACRSRVVRPKLETPQNLVIRMSLPFRTAFPKEKYDR
jgi:hypothetical protein